MNSDILKGKWLQMKGKIKSRWGKLTDDDMTRIQGDAAQAAGRIQERYGIVREQAQREWDQFCRECDQREEVE